MQSGQSIDLITLQCSLIAQIFLCRADNTRLFELMITKFNAHLFPFPSILGLLKLMNYSEIELM